MPLLIALLLLITACAPKQERMVLKETTLDTLSGWKEQTEWKGALRAFKKSCAKITALPKTKRLRWPGGTAGEWHEICRKAEAVNNDPKSIRIFFASNFTLFEVRNHLGKDTGIFTGYFEKALKGSRTQSEEYFYPLYKTPSDLKKPYFERAEIDHGALDGKGLELLYVKDPIRLFFLHIQGSGRVVLEDGSEVRVGYAEQNGRDYTSIGKILVEMGEMDLEEVTAQSIQDWLVDHPHQAWHVMHKNKSYVFFRELPGKAEGPIGAQGVELTPEHSLAVDRRYIPYGMPLWLETTLPFAGGLEQPYQRLFIAQDTGGAIKGVVRGDVFFGYGDGAEYRAGVMKQQGRYVLLVPKSLAKYAYRLEGESR